MKLSKLYKCPSKTTEYSTTYMRDKRAFWDDKFHDYMFYLKRLGSIRDIREESIFNILDISYINKMSK